MCVYIYIYIHCYWPIDTPSKTSIQLTSWICFSTRVLGVTWPTAGASDSRHIRIGKTWQQESDILVNQFAVFEQTKYHSDQKKSYPKKYVGFDQQNCKKHLSQFGTSIFLYGLNQSTKADTKAWDNRLSTEQQILSTEVFFIDLFVETLVA